MGAVEAGRRIGCVAGKLRKKLSSGGMTYSFPLAELPIGPQDGQKKHKKAAILGV